MPSFLRTALAGVACSAMLLAADPLPRVDLHVHIHDDADHAKSLSPGQAADLSRTMKVRFGVLAEGGCRGDIHDNATLSEFIDSMKALPMYRGLQVYGFDWGKCLSTANLEQLDYIAADALVFPDKNGSMVMLWHDGVKFDDPQDFMERYIAFTEKILEQKIQVWSNPTYLPQSLEARYDELWTAERMDRVIRAAVKNHVAIELNTHFKIPNLAFVRRAKAAGAKFTFGSNAHVRGIGEIGYGLQLAEAAGLEAKDIWLPKRRLPE